MAVQKPENKPPVKPSVPTKQPVKQPAVKKQEPKELSPLFAKENYTWMIIGAVIVGLGMILMSGGKNQDPNVFDTNVVYSTTRITVAPILIVLGLLVEIYALFKKPGIKVE